MGQRRKSSSSGLGSPLRTCNHRFPSDVSDSSGSAFGPRVPPYSTGFDQIARPCVYSWGSRPSLSPSSGPRPLSSSTRPRRASTARQTETDGTATQPGQRLLQDRHKGGALERGLCRCCGSRSAVKLRSIDARPPRPYAIPQSAFRAFFSLPEDEVAVSELHAVLSLVGKAEVYVRGHRLEGMGTWLAMTADTPSARG